MDGLIKNLVEPARSEEDLPASAVTEVPLSEIIQTCVQTFIRLQNRKAKYENRDTYYFMRAAARQRQHRENGLSRQAETECKRTPFYFRF